MKKEELDELKKELDSWKTTIDVEKGTGSLPKFLRGVIRLVSYAEETAKQQEELKKWLLQCHRRKLTEHRCEWHVSQDAVSNEKCLAPVNCLGETHRKNQYWLCDHHGKQWLEEDNGTLLQSDAINVGDFYRVLLHLCSFELKDDVVTWSFGPGERVTAIEFDMEGKVHYVSGDPLVPWLVEELEQNEAERRNEVAQGDAWKGGFAENH
jgi:hypothetical protein